MNQSTHPTPDHDTTIRDALSVAMENLAAGGIGFEVVEGRHPDRAPAPGRPGPLPVERRARAA